MRIPVQALLLSTILFPISISFADEPRLAQFKWLTGVWHSAVEEKPHFEEHWSAGDDVMLGMSRTLKNSKTIFYESMRIEDRGESGIYFVARPKSAAQETDFKLTSQTASSITFENPEHDFPRRVTYSIKGESESRTLHAQVDDGTDKKKLTYTFKPGPLP